MSLILIGCGAAALALASGYLAARRGRAIGGSSSTELPPPAPVVPSASPPEATDVGVSLRLDDVIALASVADVGAHRERWLSGGLVLREAGSTRAVVFSAHEGVTPRFVVSYAPPRDEILWSDSADTGGAGPDALLDLGAEPPTTIERRGVVLSRVRRLHVDVTRVGKDAPRVGSTGLFVEYRSGGREALAVLMSGGVVVEAFGQTLRRAEYDVMGSGAQR